ncbi:MAG TPA: hypothetical protein VM910_38595 [Bradyrhizobium sp.]|jgi:hypothetical protein|nr:hypothetical protein [Bradyrhizobium sp.]
MHSVEAQLSPLFVSTRGKFVSKRREASCESTSAIRINEPILWPATMHSAVNHENIFLAKFQELESMQRLLTTVGA